MTLVHARVVRCSFRLTERPNGHAAGNRGLRGTLGALCSMLLLHALGFVVEKQGSAAGLFAFWCQAMQH